MYLVPSLAPVPTPNISCDSLKLILTRGLWYGTLTLSFYTSSNVPEYEILNTLMPSGSISNWGSDAIEAPCSTGVWNLALLVSYQPLPNVAAKVAWTYQIPGTSFQNDLHLFPPCSSLESPEHALQLLFPFSLCLGQH